MRLWIIYITGNFNWLKYLSAEFFCLYINMNTFALLTAEVWKKIDVEVIEYCG